MLSCTNNIPRFSQILLKKHTGAQEPKALQELSDLPFTVTIGTSIIKSINAHQNNSQQLINILYLNWNTVATIYCQQKVVLIQNKCLNNFWKFVGKNLPQTT